MKDKVIEAILTLLRSDPDYAPEMDAGIVAVLNGRGEGRPFPRTSGLDTVMSRRQAAAGLGVSLRTIDAYSAAGYLVRVGRPGRQLSLGISRESYEAFFNRCKHRRKGTPLPARAGVKSEKRKVRSEKLRKNKRGSGKARGNRKRKPNTKPNTKHKNKYRR